MAFVSTDDGKTWQGGLMIDERKKVTYPDGVQAEDGTIYIIYDYNRTAPRLLGGVAIALVAEHHLQSQPHARRSQTAK